MDMKSVMELLISKKHPEYTEDEVWREIMQFCDDNSLKIRLTLKRYRFESETAAFEEKRRQTMSLLCEAHDHDVQWMFRFITNFETAILYLLADEKTREKIFWNLSKRLECLISGEAYTIIKKIELNEKLCGRVLHKVTKLMTSEEVTTRKKDRWEVYNNFSIDQSAPRKEKERILNSNIALNGFGYWDKPYKPFLFCVRPVWMANEFELKCFRKASNALYDGLYEEGVENAFLYSRLCKGRASFYSSGLVLDENGDIVFLAYIFRDAKGEKKIYRCKLELAHFPETAEDRMDAETLCEVTEEEFYKFYRMLYKKEYEDVNFT